MQLMKCFLLYIKTFLHVHYFFFFFHFHCTLFVGLWEPGCETNQKQQYSQKL